MNNRAVALVSGGLDSATALGWAKGQDYCNEIVKTIHFQYGQSHANEIECAKAVCEALKCPQPEIIKLNLEYARGHSALMPLGGFSQEEAGKTTPDSTGEQVSATFVPGRNIVMLAIMAGIAEVNEASIILGGWNAEDYSGYPDCRPVFLHAMDDAIRLGLKQPVRILAPLSFLSKAEIIKMGAYYHVPYELTWSCYAGGEAPCGQCPSCQVRSKGFAEAGLVDPAL
jgi:7-cyano-7-deazaguanine synthase